MDEGDLKAINRTCPAPATLHLKVDAPVVLLVNVTNELVNGLLGKVISVSTDTVGVFFPSLNKQVPVKKSSFTHYSAEKQNIIASRYQFPLNLAFALTVHKAQGMTLERLKIDCRHMNNPGQIGVAVGRASLKRGLCIINFRQSLLRRHPASVSDFYSTTSCPLQKNRDCCNQSPLVDKKEDTENEVLDAEIKLDNDSYVTPEDDVLLDESVMNDAVMSVITAGEDDETDDVVELPHAQTDHSVPLETCDVARVEEALNEASYKNVLAIPQALLNVQINHLISNDCREHLTQFCHEITIKLKSLLASNIPEEKVSHRDTTAFYRAFTVYIGSPDYKNLVSHLFAMHIDQMNTQHYRSAYIIVDHLREESLRSRVAAVVQKDAEESAVNTGSTFLQSDGGRGTIRYIGGWAIATLLYKKKQAVKRLLYSKKGRERINAIHQEILYLELLIEDEQYLIENSADKPSLCVTNNKQYVRRGLGYVSDKAFQFFLKLDNEVRSLESRSGIHLHGENLFVHMKGKLLGNNDIGQTWKSLFHSEDETDATDRIDTDVAEILLGEVLHKYCSMSINQLRKTYVQELKKEKEEAHRKQIKIKGDKYSTKCDYQFLLNDTSRNKERTDLRLKSELKGNASYLDCPLFTKPQLLVMCEAYKVSVRKSERKRVIAEALGKAILQAKRAKWDEASESESGKICILNSSGYHSDFICGTI